MRERKREREFRESSGFSFHLGNEIFDILAAFPLRRISPLRRDLPIALPELHLYEICCNDIIVPANERVITTIGVFSARNGEMG